ncbi:HlyC/CorC family transporter [candidate division KSB1 bacterium]|nr:HlyC/CorC family transporter [candidate division KSB1 bacterium]
MEIALFVLTLFLSGFFSGSETAYLSANRLKLYARNRLSESDSTAILADENRFLTTTLVGNNVVMVGCSSLSVYVFASLIPDSLLVVFTTFFLLIFGEIIPKSLAQAIPNRLIKVTPVLMQFFYIAFFPLIWFAAKATDQLVRMIGGDPQRMRKVFYKNDLPFLMRTYSSFTLQEHQLIARATHISKKRLNEFMVPRMQIEAIQIQTPPMKIAAIFKKTGFSRLPVYNQDLDDIVGFFYLLDILTRPDSPVAELMRPAFFLPENIKAIQALDQMRKMGKSMVVLVDEHGGTAGLITIEDMVEQIFGEIFDEFDLSQPTTRVLDELTIVSDGRTEIAFLNERYKLALPLGDYATIAGLIIALLGRIPRVGEEVQLAHCKLVVTRADERRIEQIKILKN